MTQKERERERKNKERKRGREGGIEKRKTGRQTGR